MHTEVVSLAEVLIVEDEQFTRTMLALALQTLGFSVIGQCANARDSLEAIESAGVDVAVLDLDLGPGPSGVDIAHALRARSPRIGLVLLTTFTDPRLRDPHERPLPQGTRYLVKRELDHPETLRSTIMAAKQYPLKDVAVSKQRSPLTPLQLDVLRMVATGLANSEIAEAQGVTDKAVERTIQRITETLGMSAQGGNKRVLLTRAYSDLTGKSLPS